MPTSEPSVPVEAAAPVLFRGRALKTRKRFIDGTHRAAPPHETLARIRPHFRRAGLTRLADVTGLDRIGIPTAIGYRPNSPTLSSSSGKGFTLEAALVSGAMEAIELYHAENPRLPARRAPYAELEAEGTVIVRRDLVLSRASLFNVNHPEFWVQGFDLAQQRETWVPFSVAALASHPERRPAFWMPFPMSSNGLASGNELLEAVCAGLLEIVERDAVACHVTARKFAAHQYPRIRLDTLPFARVNSLIERLQRADVGVLAYDLSVDSDVPVYMAAIYDRVNRHVGMYAGYGAHLDPEIAMIRALTEAVQSRLIYIAGSRDDYFRHDYLKHRMNDSDEDVQALDRQPAVVDLSGRQSESTPTFEGDIAVVLAKLARLGHHEVIVVDLSHEEIGVPVVRVIVPGFEATTLVPNYAPGRRALAFAQARRGRT